MKEMTGKATSNTAYGKKLDTPIEFEFRYMAYETKAEVEAAGELLSDQEIVDYRNEGRLSKARTKQQGIEWEKAGIKKPTLEDPVFAMKEFYRVLMGSKRYTEAQAKEIASTHAGIPWQD